MTVRRILVLVLLLTMALAVTPLASAKPTIKRQAELNILHATRLLASWHIPAVNPRTHTLRSNTTVVCHGSGRYRAASSGAHLYQRYLCVLHYRTYTYRFVYGVQHGSSFSLHRVRTFAAASP